MIPDPPEGDGWRWILRFAWDDPIVRILTYIAVFITACGILTGMLS